MARSPSEEVRGAEGTGRKPRDDVLGGWDGEGAEAPAHDAQRRLSVTTESMMHLSFDGDGPFL
jgi:hypothetical protein